MKDATGVMVSMTKDDIERLELLMIYMQNMNRSDVIRICVNEKLERKLKEQHCEN